MVWLFCCKWNAHDNRNWNTGLWL